jgi:signal transduction histidine kinase
MAIGSLQQTFSGYQLPLPTWLWDLLLGLGAATVLLTSKLFKSPNKLLPRLSVWAVASLCGASLPVLVSIPIGPVDESAINGLPLSALSLLGLILFFTLVWGALTEYRASNKELLRIASELETRRENLNAELLKRQSSLAIEILSEVEPRISGIKDLLKRSDSKQAANEILDLIENLVRPLSHGIGATKTTAEEPSIRANQKPSLRALIRRFVRWHGVGSILTAHLHVIFSVNFFLPAMILAAGLNGVLYLAGFLFAQVLVFELARRLIGNIRLPHWSLLILNLIIATIANIAFVEGSKLAGLDDPEGLIEFVGLGILLVFVAAGYLSIFSAAKFEASQEIRQATARLAYLVGELQMRTASLRKQFAIDLHGDLQAKLQAALIRLERSVSTKPDLIAQVIEDLGSATLGIKNPNEKIATIESLHELRSQWDGVCDVTLNLAPNAQAKLESDSGLCAVVLEIVRERIINAVKHSSAEEIDISIELEQNNLLIFSRNGDLGVGQNVNTRRGGGSQLLDEVCLSWSLSFDAGDAVFEARLAT